MKTINALLNNRSCSISNGAKSLARTALVLAILLVPAFASAQMYVQNQTTGYTTGFISTSGNDFGYGIGNCTGNVACVANTVLFIINSVLVPVLFAIAFIVFLYGIARAYIFTMGDEAGREKGHQLMLWGLIGFVVMISIWGLVNVVANTFGLSGSFAPQTPVSYPTNAIGGTTGQTTRYCDNTGNCIP